MTRRHHPAWGRRWRRGAADGATIGELSRAMAAKDTLALRAVLHRSVTLTIDSGGHVQTASIPLTDRAAASSELIALMTSDTTVAVASINGVPGITLVRDGMVVGALTAEIRRGRLVRVWVVCNPEKLRHWNR